MRRGKPEHHHRLDCDEPHGIHIEENWEYPRGQDTCPAPDDLHRGILRRWFSPEYVMNGNDSPTHHPSDSCHDTTEKGIISNVHGNCEDGTWNETMPQALATSSSTALTPVWRAVTVYEKGRAMTDALLITSMHELQRM